MSSQLLQYYSILSYLQYGITEFTGHKITMKKTKCLVKFAIQVVGQEKSQKNKIKSQFGKTQVSCQIIGPVALVSTEEDVVRCCYCLFRQGFY